ncbi:hypothetical protein [Prauserella muralis]|uniref:Uncharacterized protein n=1 Tax=Prauserella muralis TaxID=588067 RepID=A0A2V4B827_9PSEU|nr:hypothetical protein [Prauserella muralis]PXY31397.1 hypothetical protein BAY60_03140 [Prauserella muralis]TWE14275.1 hypothetical protein FHX69_6414 [Prauserella muralis]
MEYLLTAELTSPAGGPDLDPLQQVGVVSLLDTRLSRLASIEGPDGVEITPVEHSIHAHLAGANVSWLLDAPALVFAEDATRAVLEQLLAETELLTGWQVKHCAVTATDDQLESALAAEEEPEAGDADEEPEGLTEEEIEQRRARLLEAAGQLRAFGLDAFGHAADGQVTAEEARYVAGALMHGVEMLTDELFGDIQMLEDEDTTADEVEVLWALDELPQQHASGYTALFAKQFVVATSILGHRLTQPGWTAPLCVAEALALQLAKSRAEIELDLADVLDEDRVADILRIFDEHAFDSDEHELLYEQDSVSPAPEEWFRPRPHVTDAVALHPYLADEDTEDLP